MEQMKVYTDSSFQRYEHLPMSERITYWAEYLNRLVEFSLNQPELTGSQHDSLLAEIRQVINVIQILQNEPSSRTIESKATAKQEQQESSILSSSPSVNKDVRPRSKRGTVRSSNRKDTTARVDHS